MKPTADYIKKLIVPKDGKGRPLAWALLGLVTIGFVTTTARAVEEVMVGSVSTEFTTTRDPHHFMEEIDVVLPRPVVPFSRSDAITRELRLRNRTMSEAEVLAVSQAINEEAAALGYDPLLLLALIRIESNYNHLAISPVGAEGLMQLMPPTAAWMAQRSDLEWPERHSFDPVLNVRLGTRYLARLNKQFHGRMELALTAYNRGPHNTWSLLRQYHGRLPKDIREFYAGKVFEKYRELRNTYGHLPRS